MLAFFNQSSKPSQRCCTVQQKYSESQLMTPEWTARTNMLRHINDCKNLHYYNHFMALWTLSRTTRVSQNQKVHFTIIWIFWCKIKITQADAPTVWMDCHPSRLIGALTSTIPTNFYAGCPSWHNPPNLSWLGTGTKYAGLHTWWIGLMTANITAVNRSDKKYRCTTPRPKLITLIQSSRPSQHCCLVQ